MRSNCQAKSALASVGDSTRLGQGVGESARVSRRARRMSLSGHRPSRVLDITENACAFGVEPDEDEAEGYTNAYYIGELTMKGLNVGCQCALHMCAALRCCDPRGRSMAYALATCLLPLRIVAGVVMFSLGLISDVLVMATVAPISALCSAWSPCPVAMRCRGWGIRAIYSKKVTVQELSAAGGGSALGTISTSTSAHWATVGEYTVFDRSGPWLQFDSVAECVHAACCIGAWEGSLVGMCDLSPGKHERAEDGDMPSHGIQQSSSSGDAIATVRVFPVYNTIFGHLNTAPGVDRKRRALSPGRRGRTPLAERKRRGRNRAEKLTNNSRPTSPRLSEPRPSDSLLQNPPPAHLRHASSDHDETTAVTPSAPARTSRGVGDGSRQSGSAQPSITQSTSIVRHIAGGGTPSHDAASRGPVVNATLQSGARVPLGTGYIYRLPSDTGGDSSTGSGISGPNPPIGFDAKRLGHARVNASLASTRSTLASGSSTASSRPALAGHDTAQGRMATPLVGSLSSVKMLSGSHSHIVSMIHRKRGSDSTQYALPSSGASVQSAGTAPPPMSPGDSRLRFARRSTDRNLSSDLDDIPARGSASMTTIGSVRKPSLSPKFKGKGGTERRASQREHRASLASIEAEPRRSPPPHLPEKGQ